ncbi:type II secretion system protein [Noviherbaspirillum sp.]|uniref:type IV pilus modification PilV family protein n=1 Tax=Noviherbaspirillum sp. TaxID=1926288 RepID=UPI002B4751DB|nr:type II secretion system protein [Noviherbaspirillum sp.]HJV83172.1 type II secretion system protein [Noviherbaspirillum sp.]HJW54947.1 type II secretion system protein [Burkholderiaceae bacterium]
MSIRSFPVNYRALQSGISFVELIMFIVIVSVGIVGILSVMNLTTAHSSDPLVRKQAIAIAESLLEEIEMQPFSYCDPDDPSAASPAVTQPGDCAIPEGFGPEGGETRTDSVLPFDNVNDYVDANGVPKAIAIVDVSDNTAIAGLSAYSATVTITQESVGSGAGAVAATESLRIDVRVTGPAGTDVTLTGYRLRYAPWSV